MSTDLVKYAFIAGEISPTLFGRGDLTKYDLGMALARNFFVDYRGGLSTRPGTEFGDFIKHDDKTVKFFEFHFSPDLSDTYVLLFGDEYIRFIQDNAYVLESSKTVASITADVFTVTSHGYSNGNWVKVTGVGGLDGITFIIANATANTFTLNRAPTAAAVTGIDPYTSGGTVSRIYEIVSPYDHTDLAELRAYQYRDLLRLTHKDYAIRNLVRNDHTSWALSEEVLNPIDLGPFISSHSVQTAGSAEVIFAVTYIDADGNESARGSLYLINNTNNYAATEGSVTINWAAEPDAVSYNIYRSVISGGGGLSAGAELGFIGKAYGTRFTDPNIVPDFTKAPPTLFDPFANGSVESITITNGGSGYGFQSPVTLTDANGSGFSGTGVVNSSGAITNINIRNHGKNYTSPTIVFGGSGTGATGTVNLNSATGRKPALSSVHQQRQVYAASIEQPLTVWGSQIKRFSNFTASPIVIDSDSYEFDVDSPSIAPIRHMLVTRGGLLLMTQENIWLLSGGSANAPITPTNALADPQTYNGVSALEPIQIGSDILFTEGRGFAVRTLAYNEISKVYSSEDRSILSNHLFGEGRTIVNWAYQESPYKVVWGIREDGYLVTFTTVREEDVFAWTHGSTKGLFKDIVNIKEGEMDRIYFITERYINGRWTKFFERMAERTFEHVEDAWCVDAGLTNVPNFPATTLSISTETDGEVILTAGASSFTGKENWIVRAAGGRFKITEVTSATVATALVLDSATNLIPEDVEERVLPIVSGEWTLDEPETVFGGLWHLEGETVSILGDGNVFPQQTVINGQITLSNAVTRVIIGLPFQCVAQTLPMIVPEAAIEGRRKRIPELAVRLDRSRGLEIGPTLDKLFPLRERTTEMMGQPIRLINGIKHAMLPTEWNDEGQTYFVQNDPLPATLLGIVSSIEVGDDPN